MAWLELSVIALYALFLVFIFVYSLSQLDILLKFKKAKKTAQDAPFNADLKSKVTVQLPVFNEKYVIERLINAVCDFDYPKDQLQIQVLDDSTDETKDLIEKIVAQKKVEGFEIEHIHRTNRDGFKAGALRDAMPLVKGEFIAIFDADFIPPKDFMQKTVGYFINPKVGVVQTPWRHLNHDYSMLTSLQAFGLNAHFSVEQKGRNAGGHFINFNGTGGIWRKTCIDDAGGWSPSTLTEDLDLSYRAQLKGWQFLFVDSIGSPAELPANMKALRTQQFRWTKGAAECARKNLGKVLLSNLPVSTKFHATFHLLNSFIFVCVAATAILSVPVMWFKPNWPQLQPLFLIGGLFIFSFLLLGIYYWNAAKENAAFNPQHQKRFLAYFPLFLSFTMGLSIHNGIGVIEGYLGKKSPFLRTPKFNIVSKRDTWKGKGYQTAKLSPVSFIEGLLSLYFLFALFLAFYLKDFGLFPVHLMLFLGFGAIFTYSLLHAQDQ